jgi:tetratricopeptide (TPR) repeat protein/tRNA A-37 threonylcarbamoyl transferase component Bud32
VKDSLPGATYKKGDFIGQKYEVYGVLGAGGFGIVYLVYSHEAKAVYALKTFLDKYLADVQTRERFRKEAGVWVDLERHPYLVRAYFVEEIEGRLFIAMEYIAPDEQKPNSLEGYLRQRPPDLAQNLRWAIQFCHGMEYAYSKGVRCHRDIKPDNILVSNDKLVKISDFGLAGVLQEVSTDAKSRAGRSEFRASGTHAVGGTPEYMPPEQFRDSSTCDERSDMYSFGIVLFQMASGGRLPYAVPTRTFDAWFRVHSEATIPVLQSPLSPIVVRCLQKGQDARYGSFSELRANLEALLERTSGEVVVPPKPDALRSWEWGNKGLSLHSLGHYKEAILCCGKALELDPRNVAAWCNKANSLTSLGRYDNAIECCRHALSLDAENTVALNNMGMALIRLGRTAKGETYLERASRSGNAAVWFNIGQLKMGSGHLDEAVRAFDRALISNPRYPEVLCSKAACLSLQGRHEDALRLADDAAAAAPFDALSWLAKGHALRKLYRYKESLEALDRALALDPGLVAAREYRGHVLLRLGRYEEAADCLAKVTEKDPMDVDAWFWRAQAEEKLGALPDAAWCYGMVDTLSGGPYPELGEFCRRKVEALGERQDDLSLWSQLSDEAFATRRYDAALRCCERILEIRPDDTVAWTNSGFFHAKLDQLEQAAACLNHALRLNPRAFATWLSKAEVDEKLGRRDDALASYHKYIELAPPFFRSNIALAKQRIRELEGE